jgi:ketosteroid isomerase-like protein
MRTEARGLEEAEQVRERVDLVRSAYELWNEGVLENQVEEIYDRHVVLLPAPSLVSGSYRPYIGRDAFLDWARELRERYHAHFEVDEYRPVGDCDVLVLGSIVTENGDERDVRPATWLVGVRDGRIHTIRSFRYRDDALRLVDAED